MISVLTTLYFAANNKILVFVVLKKINFLFTSSIWGIYSK